MKRTVQVDDSFRYLKTFTIHNPIEYNQQMSTLHQCFNVMNHNSALSHNFHENKTTTTAATIKRLNISLENIKIQKQTSSNQRYRPFVICQIHFLGLSARWGQKKCHSQAHQCNHLIIGLSYRELKKNRQEIVFQRLLLRSFVSLKLAVESNGRFYFLLARNNFEQEATKPTPTTKITIRFH